MSMQNVIDGIKQRYPHQPEFIQAVKEVASTIDVVYDRDPNYAKYKVFERLTEPDRIISFRINWEDDEGNIQINRGWRVQFNNALGPYKGGIRFHPTVNESVLKFLGFEQIFKNALTGLPMGGGKGGSDFDPHGKSDNEIRRFCYAFIRELYHYIGKDIDVPAGDIGVSGREVSYMFAMYKNLSHEYSGVLTGKGVGFGGSLCRSEATGYGAVYFLQNMLNAHDDKMAGKTILISGAGNVAVHAAEKAIALGAKVVTLSDSKGTLYDENGFDQEKLDWVKAQKAARQPLFEYHRRFHGSGVWIPGEKPWQFDADVAMPCATQNEVTAEDAQAMYDHGIRYVVEGANMPLDADAIDLVREKNMRYAPGKAANAGGVAVSGLEMSQNSVRQYRTFEDVDKQLQIIMKNIHDDSAQASEEYGFNKDGCIDYMSGANIAGYKRVADALIAYGILN